jgi:hypothetical protein
VKETTETKRLKKDGENRGKKISRNVSSISDSTAAVAGDEFGEWVRDPRELVFTRHI